MTAGTVYTAWPEEASLTDVRADALSAIAVIAKALSLPLPEQLTVAVTEPDAEAQVVIDAVREQCDRSGIRYASLDNEWRTGLEIDPGGMRYQLVHIRDSWLRRVRSAEAAAVTS